MELSGKNQRGSGGTSTVVYCDPCLLMNKNIHADHYCVECDEFFCSNCSSVHKMSKLSRNHKLLSRDEMPRQKTASTEESVCSKHSGEILKYFCKDHDNVFCPVCVTVEHKNCSTEYIDDIAANFETSQEYRCLTEKMSSLLQQLKDIKTSSTRNNQDLQTVYTQFVSDVRTFRSEINSILDSVETAILKEAQDTKAFDMKVVQTVSTECDEVTNDVNKIVTKLEKHIQFRQKRQLAISAKKAKAKISEYEKKTGVMCSRNKIRNYKFHQNEEMLLSLQSAPNIGKLVDRGKEAEELKLMKEKEWFPRPMAKIANALALIKVGKHS